MIVVRPNQASACMKPESGRAKSSLIMRGIAVATGHHLLINSGLLMRMPIRKTTKVPSRVAARRSFRVAAIVELVKPIGYAASVEAGRLARFAHVNESLARRR